MRRLLDLGIALVVLPVLAPVFVVVMLAVMIDTSGNPFYGGWRVGRGGERFRMWKFRTMVKGADQFGKSVTSRHDPRITRIGRFLRAAKIDELPQFFNLLVGHLTLIGPRAETPDWVDKYTEEQRQILKVKPGITGPTQLRYTVLEAEMVPDGEDAGRFYLENLMDKKLRLDLEYIRTRTVRSDCRVVLQTIKLMLGALTSFYRNSGVTTNSSPSRELTRNLGEP